MSGDHRVDPRRFEHPSTETELIAIVKRAREAGGRVRIRGSGHSVDEAIYAGEEGIDVMLDRYRDVVSVDEAKKRVTVQAGRNLHHDPADPTGRSTPDNGLVRFLDEKGWALSNLGGITHQTIAGFSQTGSSGGSVRYSTQDNLVAVRIIDGQGVPHDFDRDDDPDRFFAASLAMGLLGIVSTVTVQCEDRYDIIGEEAITEEKDCAIDLFGDSSNGLGPFLEKTEYARLMWWPQKRVEKMVVWKARRMNAADYDDTTAPGGTFKPKHYTAFGDCATFKQRVAGFIYKIVGNVGAWPVIGLLAKKVFIPLFMPIVINAFVPNDGDDGPQHFWDTWWNGLPMDNEVQDHLIPTEFTEMWFPVERTRDVMVALRDHYRAGGWKATGTYLCEIYASKANPMWMSPAHGQDVVRFDMFWFAKNAGDPVKDYYPQFWALLEKFSYRLHWGKFLPDDPSLGDTLRKQYPRWDEFMTLRREMDPDDVFLTDYWRRHLGISPSDT